MDDDVDEEVEDDEAEEEEDNLCAASSSSASASSPPETPAFSFKSFYLAQQQQQQQQQPNQGNAPSSSSACQAACAPPPPAPSSVRPSAATPTSSPSSTSHTSPSSSSSVTAVWSSKRRPPSCFPTPAFPRSSCQAGGFSCHDGNRPSGYGSSYPRHDDDVDIDDGQRAHLLNDRNHYYPENIRDDCLKKDDHEDGDIVGITNDRYHDVNDDDNKDNAYSDAADTARERAGVQFRLGRSFGVV